MKAIMATLMIALAVCFTGCNSENDAADPAEGGDAPEETQRRQE